MEFQSLAVLPETRYCGVSVSHNHKHQADRVRALQTFAAAAVVSLADPKLELLDSGLRLNGTGSFVTDGRGDSCSPYLTREALHARRNKRTRYYTVSCTRVLHDQVSPVWHLVVEVGR